MMKKLAVLLLTALLLTACGMALADEQPVAQIRLNEVITSCSGDVLVDESGASPDWVEIFNAGEEAVSLKGLCLSDGTKKLDKFVFPDVTIPAGGYQIVLCSGEDRITETELHTSFKLSTDGETVVLSYEGKVLDSVKVGRQAQDVSYARTATGAWAQTYQPTPGSANVIAAMRAPAQEAATHVRSSVQLNEVMASASPFRDSRGYDYVELYNSGSRVDLAKWSITLSGKEEKVFTFPGGTRISKDECLVVYFTDSQSILLTSGFSIPSSYGTLTLKNAQGEVVDVLSWSEPLYGNLPYGRPAGSSEICFLEKETRGTKNPKVGYAVRADAPKMSVEGGFYEEAFTVELTADQGQTIYYTTDGTAPTRNSRVYNKPITVSKTTVLRAAAGSPSAMLSEAAAATYFFGVDIDAPVVSVMINKDYLYDPSIGMMAQANYLKDWEYPVQVEYFDADGQCTLNQQAGVMVSGAVSRRYTQKSMAFFSRKAYGDGDFSFNPFPNRDYESVQAFVLRNGGSEGLYNGVRFRDLFLTRLAMKSHAPVSDGQPVLVYINGELYGHYNIRERVNKDYFAAWAGITDEDVIDQIDILNATGMVANGSADDYLALSRYMARHDLNNPAALEYVLSQLDVDSLFDYAAYEMITGNKDLSNTRFFRVPGGKWTWTLYDLDTAMGDLGSAPVGYFMAPVDSPVVDTFDHVPFSALMKVPEMKDKFLRRMGGIMAEYFTYENLSAELDRWYEQMQPVMKYHMTRWSALNMNSWTTNVETMRKLLKQRLPQVVKDVQRIFKLTNSEVQEYFGDFLEKNGQ